MRAWLRALAFFRVVPLHSFYMVMGLTAVSVFGVVILLMNEGQGTDALMPVLLLHVFAVSSGFTVPARRGHFDLLLTAGMPRVVIAITHWLVSAAPGVAAWLTLGVVELIVKQGSPTSAFSTGTIAAVLMISTFGWALTVSLPRLTGGVVWLVTLFVALTISAQWRAALFGAAEGHGSPAMLAIAFVLNPLFVVGTRLNVSQMLAIWPAVAAGVIAVVAACAWIARMDIGLEVAQ